MIAFIIIVGPTVAFATVLLMSLPFSMAVGIHLGLRGARFVSLLGVVVSSLAVVAALATVTKSAVMPIPTFDFGSALATAGGGGFLFIWLPELVIAAAFGAHAFLHRNRAQRPRGVLASFAIAASAEALTWMTLVFGVLPRYPGVSGPSTMEFLVLGLIGTTGVCVFIVPGWAVGRTVRWGAGRTTPRLAWTIWPCWLLCSTAIRLYGPAIIR